MFSVFFKFNLRADTLALMVGRYGRYGNPKTLRSVYPRPVRALTVGRYGRYGNSKRPRRALIMSPGQRDAQT